MGMKIGLLGFELESPNKGCEALSYAFIDFLQANRKEGNLTIYVLDSECCGEFPKYFPDIDFIPVPLRIKEPRLRWIRAIAKCDFVFDITMGDSFSDIYSKEYCMGLIKRKWAAELLNRRYILMPQTYGPFVDDVIRKRAIQIITKAYKVFSRDKVSIEYLRKLGVKEDITECIDLAFMLPYDKTRYTVDRARKNLGINISGLLWKGGFNSDNQFGLTINYRKYIRTIIETYVDCTEWNVHLIPHVIDLNPKAHDDDYLTLKALHAEFPKTLLSPIFTNPIDAKSYIANMDCFIGARMHSAIAAFSSGVAAIPVTYSRKFEGLFNTLNYPYLIHGKEYDTDLAIKKTVEYVNNYQLLYGKIQETEFLIEEKVKQLKKRLKYIIDGV